MEKKIGTLGLLFAIILLCSCSREVEESKLRIQTPKFNGVSSKNAILSSANGSAWSGSFTASSDINCYGVFVGAPEPGLDHSFCRAKGQTAGELMRFGVYAAGVPAGQVINLDVPSGPARKIALVGMKANAGSCFDFHGIGPPVGQISHPRVIAVQTLDLEPGEKAISFDVPADLSANTEVDFCDIQDVTPFPGGGTLPPTLDGINVFPFHLADKSDSGFQIFQEFIGDDNNNSTITAKYCAGSCDPFASGTAISMTRDDTLGFFYGEDTSVGAAGATFTVGVQFSDPDGVLGPVTHTIEHKLIKEVYRSVGPGEVSPLVSGSATDTFSLGGTVAIFNQDLPPSVGVGDALEYDSDANGSIDAVAFLSFRVNARTWVVRAADGAAPTNFVDPAEQDWKICRAYTSLSNWEGMAENTCIDSGVSNFDSITPPLNIRSGGTHQKWFIALYPGTGPDTTGVIVDDWDTDGVFNLTFFTPRHPVQAGQDFGHFGVLDTTNVYYLQTLNDHGLYFQQPARGAIVDGLQVSTNTSPTGGHRGIRFNISGGTGDYTVKNSIIFAETAGNGTGPGIGVDIGGTVILRAFNNVLYDWFSGSGAAINVNNATGSFIFNNTIANVRDGIIFTGTNTVLKNNLVGNSTGVAYSGTAGVGSGSNISEDGTAGGMGTGSIASASIIFNNPASFDFSLSPSDASGAIDGGLDLSSDPNIPFKDDIRLVPRGPAWDMGAFEF